MTKKTGFAGNKITKHGDRFFQSFMRLIARSRADAPAPAAKADEKTFADPGAEPCWTAALNRGGNLPRFRLSILNAADSPSPMRLEPCRSDRDPSRPAEL
jgi:hypothetical protein